MLISNRGIYETYLFTYGGDGLNRSAQGIHISWPVLIFL